tara:strand:- start:2600 stop:3442 length:843 start_codon:yes stop_codon:yes gene_type:complete
MPTPTTIDTDTELSAVNSILGAIGQSPVTTLGTTTEITGEVKYTGDNSDVTFSIVDLTRTTDSEVKVKLDGALTTAYSISGNTLTFTSAPGTGVSIRIYREKEVYNTYANPEVSFIYNILTEVNKDVQNEGWVFNLEEKVTKTPDAETGYITIPANVLRYDLHDNLSKKTMNLTRRNGRLYDTVDHTDVFTGDLHLDIVYLWPFEDLPSVFKRYITYRASVRAATQLVSNPQLVQLLAGQEAYARANCMEYECQQGDHSFFGTPPNSIYSSYKPYYTLRR